jgi:hypothetical protein
MRQPPHEQTISVMEAKRLSLLFQFDNFILKPIKLKRGVDAIQITTKEFLNRRVNKSAPMKKL